MCGVTVNEFFLPQKTIRQQKFYQKKIKDRRLTIRPIILVKIRNKYPNHILCNMKRDMSKENSRGSKFRQ